MSYQGHHGKPPRKGWLRAVRGRLGVVLRLVRRNQGNHTEPLPVLSGPVYQDTITWHAEPPAPVQYVRYQELGQPPSDEAVASYVADITSPDLRLPSFDPDPKIDDEADPEHTRFDLIRRQPYMPITGLSVTATGVFRTERETDEGLDAGPGYTVAHGGDGASSGYVRVHPELYPCLLSGADTSPDGCIPPDAATVGGLAYVRGWTRDAAPEPEGGQALAAAGSPGSGGYRNPGS